MLATVLLVATLAVGAAGVVAAVVALVRSGPGWLGVGLGGAAIVVGFLGTVVGLISSFQAVGHVEPARKAEQLSTGISTAMGSTAAGLGLGVLGIVLGAIALGRRKRGERAPR